MPGILVFAFLAILRTSPVEFQDEVVVLALALNIFSSSLLLKFVTSKLRDSTVE